MKTFSDFLSARNLDANELTPELRSAMVLQWKTQFPQGNTQESQTSKVAPVVTSAIVIPDDTPEDRIQQIINAGALAGFLLVRASDLKRR